MVKMKVISAAVFSALLCTVLSASVKVKEEKRPAFFGEDVHIDVPAGLDAEVLFRSRAEPSSEVVLLRGGQVLGPRGRLSSDGRQLVLEAVLEEDEGTYLVKNGSDPADVTRLVLIVRDCAVEQTVKYGDTYDIRLDNIQGPITLEFRTSLILSNESQDQPATDPPAVVLYNQTAVSEEEYVDRLSVTEKRVTLHAVRMTDEGSFTVLDRDGKVRKRNCLNVREHQEFIPVPYDGTLKAKLYLHYSMVSLIYTPNSDQRDRLVVDRGVLVVPMDPQLQGRLTVNGSWLTMTKMRESDKGMFKVTDLAGYAVAYIYPEVEVFKMPTLHTAILSLVGIVGVMLLMCLVSCQYKVYQRTEKGKRISHVAEEAGNTEGDTFRQTKEEVVGQWKGHIEELLNPLRSDPPSQTGAEPEDDGGPASNSREEVTEVVRDAYTRFTEESQLQSTWENATESTDVPPSEVTIRGLEVSKPAHYHDLPSYTDFLQMSDSGVEFTSFALPLDSDSDATHKPLLDAASPTGTGGGGGLAASPDATVVVDGDLSVARTPESAVMSASVSPASNPRNVTAAATPDVSPGGAVSPGGVFKGLAGPPASAQMPDGGASGSPRGPVSPGRLSKCSVGSDSAQMSEGGAGGGEGMEMMERMSSSPSIPT